MSDAPKGPQVYYPSSTAISEIRFDPETDTALVVFAGTGKTTEISNIDQDAMNEWLSAPSVGRFFVENYQRR